MARLGQRKVIRMVNLYENVYTMLGFCVLKLEICNLNMKQI